jgi:hypothetical protein
MKNYCKRKKTFNCPFYLTSGELLYAFKIYQTSTAVVLLCRIHHAIFDGVSQKIFINEIAAAYNNAANNNCTLNEIGAGTLTAGQLELEQLASVEMDAKYDELIKRIKNMEVFQNCRNRNDLTTPPVAPKNTKEIRFRRNRFAIFATNIIYRRIVFLSVRLQRQYRGTVIIAMFYFCS